MRICVCVYQQERDDDEVERLAYRPFLAHGIHERSYQHVDKQDDTGDSGRQTVHLRLPTQASVCECV